MQTITTINSCKFSEEKSASIIFRPFPSIIWLNNAIKLSQTMYKLKKIFLEKISQILISLEYIKTLLHSPLLEELFRISWKFELFKDTFICLLIAQLFKKQCVNLKVLMTYAFNVPITNLKRIYDKCIRLWNYLRNMALLSKWHELIPLFKSFIKIEGKHLKYTLWTCHGFQQYFGCCFLTLVVVSLLWLFSYIG